MRSLSVLFVMVFLLFVPSSAQAHDVTVSGTNTFAALDGSSSDHDGAANGVFTVSDGNLSIAGIVNCNDDSTTSACSMAFSASGDIVIDGALYAENRSGGGTGGAITLTAGRDLVLNTGAIVSSASKSSSGATGGNITATVSRNVALAADSTIDAGSSNAKGGTIIVAASGAVSVDGNVLSGPSRTFLATRLTGAALDGGTSNQIGGEIRISSSTFLEPALVVGSNANVVSQGDGNGAGPVIIDGCGIVITGHVAALSRKDSAAKVSIRSGKDLLIDASDLGVAGATLGRNGRVRADAPSGTALNKSLELLAAETITILGPAAASSSSFPLTSLAGVHDSKSFGGVIRIVSTEDAINASGNVADDGRSAAGDSGGPIDIAAKGDVTLTAAVIRSFGDSSTNNPARGGGSIAVRSYSGNIIWTNGLGDVRPTGSASGLPPSDQGTITLTACGTVTTTGTSFPVNGSPTGPWPATTTGACSPATPSLPAGVILVTCNTPPVANDASASTNEDTTVTITLSGSDADGDSLTFSIVAGPFNGVLGPIVQVTPTSATVDYTPNANYNGADSFVYQANDGNGGTDTAAVAITIAAVNDPPSFLAGPTAISLEDAGPQTYPNWATAISAGPADESGQTVTFTVTNDNNALFAVQPSVSSNGTLTYTAAPNAYGSANVSLYAQDNGGIANGGDDTSDSQTSAIDITPVNDAPSFTKGADQTAAEDSGAQTVSGWATGISAGPNEGSQTVSFVVTNNNSSLFSTAPAVASDGTLTYTPAADANGTAVVTIYAQDDGGTANGGVDSSAAQTFNITVTAVNDPPSFTSGGDVSAFEDSAAYSAGWATAISAGPADESTQTVTFSVTNDNNALFSVQPAVASNGTLTFTLNANAFGSANVSVTATDDGAPPASSAAQTFTITVNNVNDEPTFTAGGNVSALEDSGAYSAAWATSISAGPGESDNVSFNVTNDNNSLFASQPAINSSGVLTFTTAANAYGTATVTVFAKDDGGTANGGDDTSSTVTFTITLDPVNDAPSFTSGGDVSVGEDSGAYSAAWATAISAGPSNESSQTVAFIVSNSNNSLFSAQPSISPSGVLTFTPNVNATGSATVTVYAQDNGGTANGGVDVSASQTFTITVNGVNDPPSFTPGANQTSNEDAGPQTVSGWATNISSGPGESDNVTFFTSNDNPTLFSAQPSVAPDGTLTYTASANANGVATVTVYAKDDGGGNDTSASYTFTITIVAVNDAPSFTGGGNVSVLEDSGAYSAAWATAISAGPADEAGQTLTFNVSNSNNSFFSAQPAISASGVLSFTVAANAFGNVNVTVSLSDNGGTANGGSDTSASQTFTITINGVNDAPSFVAGPDVTVDENDGPQSMPWATSISAGPNESGQVVTFVTSNSNPSLFSAQPAISASGTLTFNTALNASGSATVTVYLTDNGGTANGGVDTSASVTFTITVNPVNDPPNAAGDAYDTIGNTVLQVAASKTVSDPAVFVTGSVLANDTDVDSPPGSLSATLISGSVSAGAIVTMNPDGTFTYLPPAGHPGATDSFSYQVSDGSASSTGTVTITLKSRVWYVRNNAPSGGSGRSTDPFRTLPSGEAASVPNDTVFVFTGDGTTVNQDVGFMFKSGQRLLGQGVALTVPVSVNGGPNPTVLLAAGTKPRMTSVAGNAITIDGVSNVLLAGLTIDGTLGDGVNILNASTVAIDTAAITNSRGNGIFGSSVVGFTLTNSTVNANGDSAAADESGIAFVGLTGTAVISDTTIGNSIEDNVRILNTTGVLNRITFTNVTFGAVHATTGNDSLRIEATGGTLNATIEDSFFTNARGDLFQFTVTGSATSDLVFRRNALSNNHAAIVGGGGGMTVSGGGGLTSPTLTYLISQNTFRDALGAALAIIRGSGAGSFNGTVDSNTIGVSGVANSGSAAGSAIFMTLVGGGSSTTAVTNNTIRQYNNYGIFMQVGNATSGGNGSLNATVTGNTISQPASASFPQNGFHLNSGVSSSGPDAHSVCLNLANNTLAGSGKNGGTDFFLRQRFSTTVRLPGYAGANNNNTAVVAFVQSNNAGTPTGLATNTVPTGGGFVGGAACTLP